MEAKVTLATGYAPPSPHSKSNGGFEMVSHSIQRCFNTKNTVLFAKAHRFMLGAWRRNGRRIGLGD